MMDIRTIEAAKYNQMLADALKKDKNFVKPEWVDFVKSGANKSRPINEQDFWHKRAASILRQIYIHNIVGVQRLRTRYGSRKDRGNEPKKFVRGGGKIIRLILQQSEKSGLVEKAEGKKKGRQLSKHGREFLEKVAEGK